VRHTITFLFNDCVSECVSEKMSEWLSNKMGGCVVEKMVSE